MSHSHSILIIVESLHTLYLKVLECLIRLLFRSHIHIPVNCSSVVVLFANLFNRRALAYVRAIEMVC